MRRLTGILSLLFVVRISALASQPAVIHLRDGREMSGQIVEETSDNLLLDTPDQRRWRIPRVLVQHVRRLMQSTAGQPPTLPTPDKATVPPKPNAPPAKPAAKDDKAEPLSKPPTQTKDKPARKDETGSKQSAKLSPKAKSPPQKKKTPKGKWSHDLRLGLDLRYTAVTQQTFHSRLKSTYASKQFRNVLDWNFAYGKTANSVSADRMSGLMKSDWTFDSGWYVYHTGSAGYDIVRRIALTYEIGPGFGYHLVRNRKLWSEHSSFSFDLETGGEYEDKLSTTGFRTERYFWRLAQLIRWNINRDLTFTEEFEFFPRVGDLVNHRYRAEANLAYQLIKNLSLNFTVMAEADPQQLNDFVPDDVQIRSSLGWRF